MGVGVALRAGTGPPRIMPRPMTYVSLSPNDLVKVLGTKYRIKSATAASGRTYHNLEEHQGGGRAYAIRFEKQIVSIEGLYYRAELDMFGGTSLVALKNDELQRLGLPTPPPLTEAEAAASKEASNQFMQKLNEAVEQTKERFKDPKKSDERLSELSRLKDLGAITDSEYQAKRSEILDSI